MIYKIFTSKQCGPCKVLKVMLKDREDVIFIDIDTDEGLTEALSYGVSATPSLLTDDLSVVIGIENIMKKI